MKRIYLVIFILFIIVLMLSAFYLKDSVMISESSNLSYIDDNDIIGSIKIDSINYSNILLQGLDNTYYLDHNYLKNISDKGEIYLDYEGDLFKNNNAIIYSKKANINNIDNIKTNDRIEIFYLYKNLCYKVIDSNKNYNLEIRVIDKKSIKKLYAKKVNC